MSNYLQNLAARFLHTTPIVEPRPVSLFESPDMVGGQLSWLDTEETEAAVAAQPLPSPANTTVTDSNRSEDSTMSSATVLPRRGDFSEERPFSDQSSSLSQTNFFLARAAELEDLLESALTQFRHERKPTDSAQPQKAQNPPTIQPVEIHTQEIREKTIIQDAKKRTGQQLSSPTPLPTSERQPAPPILPRIESQQRKRPLPDPTILPSSKPDYQPLQPQIRHMPVKRAREEKQIMPRHPRQPARLITPQTAMLADTGRDTSQAEKSEPTIQVTIGRVEVRAVPAETQKSIKQSRPQPVVMSLDDYLRRRAEEGST